MIPELPKPSVHRRVAVVPIVLAAILVVVISVATTVVVMLATSTSTSDESVPREPTSAERAPAPTSSAESAPRAPAEASSSWRCVDFTGDAETLDISEVSLDYSDKDVLTATISLVADVPTNDVQLGLIAARDDGERVYQFTVFVKDREIIELTSTEFIRDDRDRLEVADSVVRDNVIEFVVPRSTAKRLGDSWSWSAFSAQDGRESDSCPGLPGSGEKLNFERPNHDDSDDD